MCDVIGGGRYEELDRLSADEKKRLEYETRLKYKPRISMHTAPLCDPRIGRRRRTDWKSEGEYLAVIQHESNRLVYTKIVL